MSKEESTGQWQAQASDSITSAGHLETLHVDPSLPILAAGNPATPTHLLEQLARDKFEGVIRAVAQNPQTPVEVLSTLAQDQVIEVQWQANLVQRLLAENQSLMRNQAWWRHLPEVARIRKRKVWEQLDRAIRMGAPVQACQTMIAVLAADWDRATIRASASCDERQKVLLSACMPVVVLEKLAASPS